MRWLALALLAGCGETAICSREVAVSITVPHSIVADLDPVAGGVQTMVSVATTFATGDTVTLEVLDDTSTIVATLTAAVDVAGVASFGLVTIPPPLAHLRASASTLCGSATDAVDLDVLAGARCELSLTTVPLAIPRYAPLGVLNRQTDLDPAAPGEQAQIATAARLGWTVEIRQRSILGEESVGSFIQSDLTNQETLTIREGGASLFAICKHPPFSLTSAAVSMFADSIAPTCSIVAPQPLIVTSAGTLSIGGHSGDDDVEGEPATLTVTPAGFAPRDANATPMMSGQTSGTVAFPPGVTSADITFATHDHAQNPCSVTGHYTVQ
jgi:hypothetical protein